VRGTTSRKLVRLLKRAGVREVHLRISSPPVVGPCFYGIDTPRREELIAANHSLEEIRKYLGVESLGYLSEPGLMASVKTPSEHCYACFTGRYPLPLSDPELREASLVPSLVDR
jgi:amidophosphoribosyltransferase